MLANDYLNLRLVRLKHGEEWTHPGHELSFLFPRGGAGECVAAEVSQRVAPGDALVLDGASAGKLRVADQGELVFWHFSLCFEHLFPLFTSNEICLLQNVTDGFKGTKLYPASSPLARECHRLLAETPPQFKLDHRSQLLRVAAAILVVEFNSAQPHGVGFVRAEAHMIQVFEKLSAAELLSLSIEELAGKFGCSRRHLSRLFHQHFGVSVAALRMEMRLLKAVTLLRNPDVKVIRVAEDCGFNHTGLFNTCFKRRFGESPGQWRKLSLLADGKPARPSQGNAACPLQVNGLCPLSGKADDWDQTPPPAPLIRNTGHNKPSINVRGTDRERVTVRGCRPVRNSRSPAITKRTPALRLNHVKLSRRPALIRPGVA